MNLEHTDTPATRRRRAALTEILQLLSSRAHAAELFVPFERLHGLSERLLARREFERLIDRRCRPSLEPAAWEELVLAHRRAQARLLGEAVELVLWRSLEGRAWAGPSLTAPCHEAWMSDASAELERALYDGVRVDGELLACCLLEPHQWSGVRELARAAARLEPCRRSQAAELRAALVEPVGETTLVALDALLREELPLAERGRLHEAAALFHERRGDLDEALDHYERALATCPGARISLAAWTLAVELDSDPARELAWRALTSTWRGEQLIGPACEGRLWREFCERRALFGPRISDATRRACEAMLWDEPAAMGAGA